MKEIIGRYLDNPETETNNEIDDMFETCFKTLLKHFEMQDYEDKCAKHGYDATDSSEEEEGEEGHSEADEGEEEEGEEHNEADEGEGEGEEQSKSKSKEKSPMKTSFWGKTINKRSTTLDEFIVKK
jgi:FtsZ-interacting cell division protein YlmF